MGKEGPGPQVWRDSSLKHPPPHTYSVVSWHEDQQDQNKMGFLTLNVRPVLATLSMVHYDFTVFSSLVIILGAAQLYYGLLAWVISDKRFV